MANRTVTVNLTTRINGDKGADGKYIDSGTNTVLTINMDDDAAVDKFAARSAAIAWQSLARAAGVISATDTVSISELAKRTGGGGFKATPENLAARVSKMSSEDYAATLHNLGIDAKTIAAMVKKHSAK